MLDQEAALIAHAQLNRWFLDPIAGGAIRTTAPGRAWRREEVLEGDMELIATTLDFLGVNYYCPSRALAAPAPARGGVPTEQTEMGWEVYRGRLTEVLEFVASRTGSCRCT